MNVVLRTHTSDPSLKLLRFGWFGAGYEHPFSSLVAVRSGPFTGEQHFYFEGFMVEEFLSQLVDMDVRLQGEATFYSLGQDVCFSLRMQALGQVLVLGEIVDTGGREQRLEFSFATDQTVLKPLISDLRAARTVRDG